mmetsp:Transcript_28693/g.49209  ORF Transcript_28693/g.49209 Transcript_28693/m.49209 type:complete len:442 (-) Transcript_28693:55-1380(-)
MHGVVEQFAVEQRQSHDVTAVRHDGVNRVECLHGMGVEVIRLGHVVKTRVAVANIVADQGQPHQRRLVEGLVATHGIHQLHRGSDARTVDTNVLEVVVVAAVALAELGVNRDDFVLNSRNRVHVRAVLGLHVAGAPGAHGLVQLVLRVLQELVEVPAVGGQPLRGNVKVRRGRVAKHDQTTLLGVLAEQVLVGARGIAAGNAVAVVVHGGIVRGYLAAGVHVLASVITIGASPVGSAEALDIGGREAVPVRVLQRQVAVHEVEDVARHVVLAGLVVRVQLEALDLREGSGDHTHQGHLGLGLGSVGHDVVHELSQNLSQLGVVHGLDGLSKAALHRPVLRLRRDGVDRPGGEEAAGVSAQFGAAANFFRYKSRLRLQNNCFHRMAAGIGGALGLEESLKMHLEHTLLHKAQHGQTKAAHIRRICRKIVGTNGHKHHRNGHQ